MPHPALPELEAKPKQGRLQKRRPAPAAAAAVPASADPTVTGACASTSAAAAEPPPDAPDAKRRAVGAAAGAVAGAAGSVTVPEPLLPNWRAAKDAQGRLYFYCTLTGEVSWHKPLRNAPQVALPGV